MKSTPDFHRFTEWSAAENARLGIDLKLGSHVDTTRLDDLVSETHADAVVVATGGLRPGADFAGGDTANVLDIRDWLASHPEVLGDSQDGAVMPEAVTIWGADSVAMSVADTLADRGTAVLLLGPQEAIAPESGRRAKILAVPRLQANPRVRIRLDTAIEEYDGTRVRVSGPNCPPAGEWLDAPGPLLVSRSVVPLDGSVAAEVRDAELSLKAGVPVTLAGTVVDQTAAIASNAVKSGYDAAQRIAARLALGSMDTTGPLDITEYILNGAPQ
jgi:hypothetical protein